MNLYEDFWANINLNFQNLQVLWKVYLRAKMEEDHYRRHLQALEVLPEDVDGVAVDNPKSPNFIAILHLLDFYSTTLLV